MSTLARFFVGLAVMIPAAAGMAGLVLAAIADGRANDRIGAQRRLDTTLPR